MGHDDAVSEMCWFDDRLYTASWDSTVKVPFFFIFLFYLQKGIFKRYKDLHSDEHSID